MAKKEALYEDRRGKRYVLRKDQSGLEMFVGLDSKVTQLVDSTRKSDMRLTKAQGDVANINRRIRERGQYLEPVSRYKSKKIREMALPRKRRSEWVISNPWMVRWDDTDYVVDGDKIQPAGTGEYWAIVETSPGKHKKVKVYEEEMFPIEEDEM